MELKIDNVFHELDISDIDNNERAIGVLREKEKRAYDKNKKYPNVNVL